MNFNRIVTLVIFFSLNCFSTVFAESLKAVAGSAQINQEWLAFGDLRGHLEPCGCDPLSDLGSVQRLDAYLRRERMLHPSLLLLHLGNDFTNGTNDLSKRKDIAIESAVKLLAPSASLLNHQEILRIKTGLPDLPYVISNFKGALPKGVKTQIKSGDRVVFGFVEPFTGDSHLNSFSTAWLVETKKTSDAKTKILLFSGSTSLLKKIADTQAFDVIVASNDLPLSKDFGDEERRDESKLVAYHNAKQEVLKVPAGGQGVIRSPALQFVTPALPISSLLEKPAAKGASETAANPLVGSATNGKAVIPTKRVVVKWLDPSEQVGVSSEMLAVIDTYRNASSAAMQSLIKARTADLATSPFIGSEACQNCHATSFKKWTESKHAHAFQTIKAAARDNDPECVSCHVLGFKLKGGFVSEAASSQFANVQCESCHGPRRAHAGNPGLKVKIEHKASDACAECHTQPHSPRFNFKEYWPRIEHK